MTKLKNSNGDKTQIENVTKLKKIKFGSNSKTQYLKKHKNLNCDNSNCDQIKKLKL